MVIEVPPEHCPNGHPLGPRQCLVGWLPCTCGGGNGHRTYTCRTCAAVIYEPPHGDHGQSASTWANPIP